MRLFKRIAIKGKFPGKLNIKLPVSFRFGGQLKLPAAVTGIQLTALSALLGRLHLRAKLLIVVAIFSLLSVVIGLVGLQGIKTANTALKDMYASRIIALQELKIMSDALTVNVVDTCHKVSDRHMAWALGRDRLNEGSQTIKDQWSSYKSHAATPEEEHLVAQIDGFLGMADGALAKAAEIMIKEDQPALNAFMIEELYASIEPVSGKLTELIHLQLELAKREYQAADSRYNWLIMLFSGMIAAGLGIAVTLALFILRQALREIDKMVTNVEQVAAGNLALSAIPVTATDEIGRLATAINSMVLSLRSLVETVSVSAEQVVAGAEETAAAVEQVSATAAEVAGNSSLLAADAAVGTASVVEVSKSLLELSSLVDIAKREATSAAANSRATLNTALEGRDTVANTVACMGNIKDKTLETEELMTTLNQYIAKIGAITATITGIASQTNLLSLNAAIEAARAGEAGRGFAVVAQEVKKLADQSTQGAAEVSALVQRVKESTAAAAQAMQSSRTEMEHGVASASQAQGALENIFTAVSNTVTDIEAVMAITDEEVTQSDRIIDLIDSLATVIENTAQQAEEVSSATRQTATVMDSLAANSTGTNKMAAGLKAAIAFFRTGQYTNEQEA
ncbi:methyl-accepting chemotaxis protein [Sporomusa termitida]|uniref:Methyl-accepting chemotaxis protein (MCP) signaling domain protein n=1 Tax=Sporomusa termitida TaxID=2377 RepID=A0A517DVR0_9FIRM|nr:methyl-accepting chemotaxis protein [Sporomusa termitida]QDR81417.1 Methyl-accepting chemotaxis protein (MCP) signaling domain protein [Sporomusa termitida]